MRKQVEESTAAESARRATGAAAERDRRGRDKAVHPRTIARDAVARHLGPHRVTPVGCRVPRGLATEPGPSQQGLGLRPADGQVRRLRPAVPAAGHRIHDMVRGGASESRQPRLRQRIGGHTRHRRRRAGTGRVHRPHRDGVRLPVRQARHRFFQIAARVDRSASQSRLSYGRSKRSAPLTQDRLPGRGGGQIRFRMR